MTTPNKWEIWLAQVMFEEGTGLKNRPILVVSPEVAYIISLKITTHPPSSWGDGEYQIQNRKEAGLQKESTIRISKVLQMKPDDFIHKIGKLHPVDVYGVQMLWERLHGRK